MGLGYKVKQSIQRPTWTGSRAKIFIVVFLLHIVGIGVFIQSHIEKLRLVSYEKINIHGRCTGVSATRKG